MFCNVIANDRVERRRWGTALMVASLVFVVAWWSGRALALGEGGDGIEAYIARDYEKAMAIWRDEAAKGDAEAMFGIGLLHGYGRGVDPNARKAIAWYKKSCDKDYVKGCYNAALLEIDEASDSSAFQRAEAFLLKSAELGHPSSQHRLAVMYLKGEGSVERNESEARFWLEQAELAGHEKSRELLVHLQNGDRVSPPVLNRRPLSPDDKSARMFLEEDKRREESKISEEYETEARRSCPLSPDVPWWGNNSYGAIKSAVATRHQGNWASYYQKWFRYQQNLEKGLANNKTAKVKQYGVVLKGPTLSGYIKKVERRLSVIRCLQQGELNKSPSER